MATRQKTVIYAFPALASVTNNTLTNFTQITVYLPDSPQAFRSVVAKVTCDDQITATASAMSTKTVAVKLGGGSYTTVTNANGTGTDVGTQNHGIYLVQDFTALFTSDWSGTSMTCDCQIQFNQTAGTGTGMVNACCTLEITYDYDDTSATQIKTVLIPLDAAVAALTTSATTYDTIPALGYFLAEPSKTFRDIHIVLTGNTQNAGLTTTHTLTVKAGTATETTATYTATFGNERAFRYVFSINGSWPSTTATQTFQLSDTVGRNNHLQAYLSVTYEFKADNSTTTLSSGVDDTTATIPVVAAANLGTAPYLIVVGSEQMLVTSVASNNLTVTRGYNSTTAAVHSSADTVIPCATNSIQLCANAAVGSAGSGGDVSSYQRITTDFYIEEPGPIKANKLAVFLDWYPVNQATGLQVRVGTGGFVAYTDNSTNVVIGSNGLMCRNDSAFTFARGLNTVTCDFYRTGSAALDGVTGYWMVCYVSAKSTNGYGAHACTRRLNVQAFGTAALASGYVATAAAPAIPETDYQLVNVGAEMLWFMAWSAQNTYLALAMERLAAEGGIRWDTFIWSVLNVDPRSGVARCHGDLSYLMKRWPEDIGDERVDLETARRYYVRANNSGWTNVQLWYTYHTCGPFVYSGNITGAGSGTVTATLRRTSDGEYIKSTTRSGNGSYSFDWWDNTVNYFVEAYDDSNKVGRSLDGIGTGSP